MNKKIIYGIVAAAVIIVIGVIVYEERKKKTVTATKKTNTGIGKTNTGIGKTNTGTGKTNTGTNPPLVGHQININAILFSPGAKRLTNVNLPASGFVNKAVRNVRNVSNFFNPKPLQVALFSDLNDIATACHHLAYSLPDNNPDKATLFGLYNKLCLSGFYRGAPHGYKDQTEWVGGKQFTINAPYYGMDNPPVWAGSVSDNPDGIIQHEDYTADGFKGWKNSGMFANDCLYCVLSDLDLKGFHNPIAGDGQTSLGNYVNLTGGNGGWSVFDFIIRFDRDFADVIKVHLIRNTANCVLKINQDTQMLQPFYFWRNQTIGGYIPGAQPLSGTGRDDLLQLFTDLCNEYLVQTKGLLAKVVSIYQFNVLSSQYKNVYSQLSKLNTPAQDIAFVDAANNLIQLDRQVKKQTMLEYTAALDAKIKLLPTLNYIGRDYIVLWRLICQQIYKDCGLDTDTGLTITNDTQQYWGSGFNWSEAQSLMASVTNYMVKDATLTAGREAVQNAASEAEFLQLATKILILA